MSKGLPNAGLIDTFRLLFGLLERYRVEGDSMVPTLQPGDEVAVDPTGTLAVGAIVVIRHPHKSDIVMIKRVSRIEEDGKLSLSSDNPLESSDSRIFGAVPRNLVKGTAVRMLR